MKAKEPNKLEKEIVQKRILALPKTDINDVNFLQNILKDKNKD